MKEGKAGPLLPLPTSTHAHTHTYTRLECRHETGLILRCDRKVGNPFQTKQGSRPSCRDHEGRRGSEEVVPENLGVPLQPHGKHLLNRGCYSSLESLEAE